MHTDMVRFVELGGQLINLLTVRRIERFDAKAERRQLRNQIVPDAIREFVSSPLLESLTAAQDPALLDALEEPDQYVVVIQGGCGCKVYVRESWENVKSKLAAARLGLDE